MTAPKLPQRIHIDRPTGKVTVDGEPFPFHILAQTLTITLDPDNGALQTVNLTIPAEHITITDEPATEPAK